MRQLIGFPMLLLCWVVLGPGLAIAETVITCDGVSDITEAIHRALDAGQPVRLVRGASARCPVTQVVLPGGSMLTCEGTPGEPYGPPGTPWWTTQTTVRGVHLHSASPGAIVRLVQDGPTGVARSVIRSCGIVGQLTQANQDGIVIDSGGALLEDVTITGVGGVGLRLRWSQGGSYTRVISAFHGADGVAIDPDPAISTAVTFNLFRELQTGANAGYGFVIHKGGIATRCEACDFENNRRGGVALLGAWDSTQGYMQQIRFTDTWIGCSPGVTTLGVFVDAQVRASRIEQVSGGCPVNIDETGSTWRQAQ